MAKIEKLERIFLVRPDANGVYQVRADLVSHEVARAREDALLGAAKESLKYTDCEGVCTERKGNYVLDSLGGGERMKYEMNREVLSAVHDERVFQNRKWGTVDEHPHEVGGIPDDHAEIAHRC